MERRGIRAAPGCAIGRAYLLDDTARATAPKREPGQAGEEERRLDVAISTATAELEALASTMRARLGAAETAIIDSHRAFLRDPEIVGSAKALIMAGGVSAEDAVANVIEENAAIFDGMDDDPLLKERAADIRDVGKRIERALSPSRYDTLSAIPSGSVIVARDLRPSETARLDPDRILGFAVDSGGPTSHSAILAKALGIAAVVGLGDVSSLVSPGQTIIIDGDRGLVIVDPDATTVSEYEALIRSRRADEASAALGPSSDATTASGRRVIVAANVASAAEARKALERGAEGVGLFRTEFLFMDRLVPPGEEEQFRSYKETLEAMDGKPVIIRTLDIGGDKDVPYLGLPKEENPFLGLRAIRLCMARKDLFRIQLRALLRAADYGDLSIMFPMIGSIRQLKAAKAELSACLSELTAEGLAPKRGFRTGAMIEIPSAALQAEALAAECDFFSIGSNDLTQYTLAVDRMNRSVAELYDPLDPAVLRLVKMTADAARDAGIPCGVCGEMAGDPEAIPILIDYGIDELSMGAASIPAAKAIVAAQP